MTVSEGVNKVARGLNFFVRVLKSRLASVKQECVKDQQHYQTNIRHNFKVSSNKLSLIRFLKVQRTKIMFVELAIKRMERYNGQF
jgi:hypothetical protein